MVLAEWAGKSVQPGCICHFINSINTSVVAAMSKIKCQ